MKTGLRSSSSSGNNNSNSSNNINSNNNNNNVGDNEDNHSQSFLTPPLTPQPAHPLESWDMPTETKSQTSRKTRGAGALGTTKSRCPKNTNKHTTLVRPGELTAVKADAVGNDPMEADAVIESTTEGDSRRLNSSELKDIETERGASALAEQDMFIPQLQFSLHQIDVSSSANEARSTEHNIPYGMDERSESEKCSATTALPKGKRRKQSQKDDDYKDNDLEGDKDAPPPKKKTRRSAATARPTPSSQAKQPPKKKAATVRASKRRPDKAATAQLSESLSRDIDEASEAVRSTPKRGRRSSAAVAAPKPRAPAGGKKTTRTRISVDSSSRNESLCRSESNAEPICEFASANDGPADNNDDSWVSAIESSNGRAHYTSTEAVAAQVIAELYRDCPNLGPSAQNSSEQVLGYSIPDPEHQTNLENIEDYEGCHQLLPIQIPQEVFDKFLATQQSIYDWGFRDGMRQRLEREHGCDCEARWRHSHHIHSASAPLDEPAPLQTPAPNSLSPK
ncbi:hypothetical protein BGZ80_000383 [Entomortierella chlamydospora]|uniref:Uncharacterized protein n=1 Tax=Entomortierella chlamydospora TaxID=101097 RepID=A0A9P6SYL9_9FUNG|nr:hypothetical protein BGZ80_000383 [Entomortierella chlamydospora]